MQAFISHVAAAQRNRNSVLHYIKAHGPIFRSEICENMGMSRASVTQIIRQLQEDGLVVETGHGESSGGRKPTYVIFNGASRQLFAFDWRLKSLKLMDLDGRVLYDCRISFEEPLQPERFAEVLQEKIAEIDAMALCARSNILGFGLSLPGLVDSRFCTMGYSAELGWQNVNIGKMFCDYFGENVYADRFTNILALGEYASGREKEVPYFQLYVLGYNGIGVSTVVDGKCWHGANYMHGELGHIKLQSDIPCSCGQRGCLEAIVQHLMETSGGTITLEILEYLSIGIASSINLTDANVIVLTGSIVEKMTNTQREQLRSLILERVTGMDLRKLEIRYREDTRLLTQKGICAFVFDQCYPVE